jgi:energy-coupling factor transporter ATP-binding protein EcfA2
MNALQLQNLTYYYDNDRPVLNNLNYSFDKGKIMPSWANPARARPPCSHCFAR